MQGAEDGWERRRDGVENPAVEVDPEAAMVEGSADARGRTADGVVPGRKVPGRGMTWYEQVASVVAVVVLAAVAAWWFSPERSIQERPRDFVGTVVRGRVAWTVHPVMIHVSSDTSSWQLELPVSNPWNVPVKMIRARPSCNCLVPRVPQEPIAAGGQITIPVQVTVSARGEEIPVQIELEAEGGRKMIHVLNLVHYRTVWVQPLDEADRRPKLSLESLSLGEVEYGRVARGQWDVQLLYERTAGDGPVEAELSMGEGSPVRAELGPLTRLEPLHDGRIGRYGAVLTVELPEGKVTSSGVAMVLLRVTVPGHARHQVPLSVVWSMRRVLEVEPTVVMLELDSEANGLEEVPITVRHVEEDAFQVLRVTGQSPWLTGRVETPTTSGEHRVVCLVDGSQIPDWATAVLQIETDVKQQPILPIRVSVRRVRFGGGQ